MIVRTPLPATLRARRRLPPPPAAPGAPVEGRPGRRPPLPRGLRARAAERAGEEAPALLRRCALAAGVAGAGLAASVPPSRAAVALPVGAWLGWRIVEEAHERRREMSRARVRRAFPDAVERLTMCVLAGMSLERALRLVAPGTPGALGRAFGAGLRALDAGVPRSEAYARVAERAGIEEVRRLVSALARAERLGSPVAGVLAEQARDARARLRAAAETEASTAPVRLLFPTALCFLPAFLLLTITPIVLSALKALRGV